MCAVENYRKYTNICISTSCQSWANAKQIVHKVQNVSQPISNIYQPTNYTLNRITHK